MAFRPTRTNKLVFADLKPILAQTKDVEQPLYQVVEEIIDRLSKLNLEAGTSTTIISGGGGGGGGGGPAVNATVFTKNDETGSLANSVQLITRYGLKNDDSNASRRIVDLDLEYLGNFVAGPLYSDGDVVIGPDNIAYLCVKPTNTPPVTWPGVGMATAVGPPGPAGPAGPQANAYYWLVTADVNLPNGRGINAFGPGYVKSNGGEPSVVPTIPLTDTTGILPDNRLTSNVALKNIDNNFVPQTIAAYSSIRGANSLLNFFDTTSPVDGKFWRFLNYSNGFFYLEALNDVGNAALVQYRFGRDGSLVAGSFWGSGAGVTNIAGPNITTGIINPARLGTGVANSGTVLCGDSTWQPISGIPSGLIVLSVSPCPPGWTRITVWDGLFVRGGDPPNTGGGTGTHTHTPGSFSTHNHSHGGQTGNISFNISGQTGDAGTHSHHLRISFTTDAANAQQATNYGAQFQATPSFHAHNGTVDGNTDNDGNHSHSFSGSGGGTGSIASESVGIQGTSDPASNIPPYVNVYFCQKN